MWIALGIICALVLSIIGVRKCNYRKAFVGNPQGVDEEIYVDLQGQEQYLLIKGRNVKNPVILYLHGGPGAPDSVIVHEWSPYLTDEYTIVAWDQRGCGKTYYKNKSKDPNNETATFSQALEDLDELVDYVCKRFGQEKVIILGHSYGTLLGSRYAQLHPKKVLRYVGASQVISRKLGEIAGYEDAYRIAVEKGKDTAKLTVAYENVLQEASFDNLGKLCMLTMPFHMPPKTPNMFVMGLKSPYLKWEDVRWYLMCLTNRKELMRLSKSLLDYSFEVNLMEEALAYQVPVTFIHGEKDWCTPAVCTTDYVEKLQAPEKDLIILPHRGHSMHCEAPEEFAKVFKKIDKGGILL